MKQLPNLLTGARLVLALGVFLALAAASASGGGLAAAIDAPTRHALHVWAFAAFVVAAVTDFFDGWLARKLNATSVWGAILDPIADKVLVCAAALGLMAAGARTPVVIALGLILFREFAVSALREVAAGKGIALPVTLLAKWKTTVQLVALGMELVVIDGSAFGLPAAWCALAARAALIPLWLAMIVTLITGAQYAAQAARALSRES